MMNTTIKILAHATLCLAAGLIGCGSSDSGVGAGSGAPASGGSAGSGGAQAGVGGETASGGTSQGGSGGAVETGGAAGTGGAANTGGDPGTGGAANSGGAANTGGDPGTGGAATGGAAGAGGDNPEAGVVQCGNDTCDLASTVCCVGWPLSYACKASCAMLEASEACDGPEDCTNGQVCCAGFPSGSQCKASCTGTDQEICHTDADCLSPKTCQSCSTPGGGPSVTMCTQQCPY